MRSWASRVRLLGMGDGTKCCATHPKAFPLLSVVRTDDVVCCWLNDRARAFWSLTCV